MALSSISCWEKSRNDPFVVEKESVLSKRIRYGYAPCLLLNVLCHMVQWNMHRVLWITRRVSCRKHELISPCEHGFTSVCLFFVVGSVLLILLDFCVVFVLFCLFSFFVFVQMLLLSLDCTFLMAPLVFSNLTFMQINTEGAIKMDNLEKLAT